MRLVAGKGKRFMVFTVALCLLLAALGMGLWTGDGSTAGAAEYGAASLADISNRTLLGLYSANFATDMHAKAPVSEHAWVRNHKIELRWNEVEKNKGAWDFSKYDAMINSILQKGSDSILILLSYRIPTWAQDGAYAPYADRAPPRNMADWYNFCAKVAERYGAVTDFYEVWNEPGWDVDSEAAILAGKRHFGGQVETDYLPMLQSAHSAVKSKDPQGYVICGALPNSLDQNPNVGNHLYQQLFDDVNRPGQDVSMRVSSDQGIIAERPMYFNYNGAWTGGHDVVGSTAPQTAWLFAEGYTGDGFDEYLCLQNPGASAVTATVTYIFSDGAAPQVKTYALGANSRFTVKVNNEVGGGRDVSVKVTTPAGSPIVAERPMYFNYNGVWTGGHNVMGANATQAQWLFAEGYTGDGFDEYLCLMNPNGAAVQAQITYIFSDGTPPLVKNYGLAANSRYTVKVNEEVGGGRDVSVKVTSSGGEIVAERPMYFNYNGVWTGGHNVMGANATQAQWLFAEGYTGDGFDEYLCLMNPNGAAVQAQVTYIFADGSAPLVKNYGLAANSRYTVKVNEEVGPGREVSVKVTSSGGEIVAERPMYFNYNGYISGGHNVIGAAALAKDWYFAEGCTGSGIEEYLCLMNPNNTAANVDITYMMKAGHTFTRRVTVPPKTRQTVGVNGQLGFSGCCDGVAIHPHVKQYQDWGYYYSVIVQAMASSGCHKEVVATETGWPNHKENPYVESKEAQALAMGDVGMGALWANGCRKIWVYRDVDEDPGMAWDQAYCGLFDHTGYPYPAWSEYKYWQSQLPDYANLPSSLP